MKRKGLSNLIAYTFSPPTQPTNRVVVAVVDHMKHGHMQSILDPFPHLGQPTPFRRLYLQIIITDLEVNTIINSHITLLPHRITMVVAACSSLPILPLHQLPLNRVLRLWRIPHHPLLMFPRRLSTMSMSKAALAEIHTRRMKVVGDRGDEDLRSLLAVEAALRRNFLSRQHLQEQGETAAVAAFIHIRLRQATQRQRAQMVTHSLTPISSWSRLGPHRIPSLRNITGTVVVVARRPVSLPFPPLITTEEQAEEEITTTAVMAQVAIRVRLRNTHRPPAILGSVLQRKTPPRFHSQSKPPATPHPRAITGAQREEVQPIVISTRLRQRPWRMVMACPRTIIAITNHHTRLHRLSLVMRQPRNRAMGIQVAPL